MQPRSTREGAVALAELETPGLRASMTTAHSHKTTLLVHACQNSGFESNSKVLIEVHAPLVYFIT
jgi:hypothetical protein